MFCCEADWSVGLFFVTGLTTVIGIKYESPGNADGKPGIKVKSFVSDEYKDLVELAARFWDNCDSVFMAECNTLMYELALYPLHDLHAI